MPTYQYRCTECGRDLEVVQKFSDPSLTECPSCAGALRKVYNAVGVVFKGSGFYRTDSRAGSSDGESASDKKAGDSGAKGEAAGNGSGDGGKGKEKAAPATSSGSGSDNGSGSDKNASNGGTKTSTSTTASSTGTKAAAR